ncbi:hypothetical protein [Virgisporangium aurantiacum]|uniref:Uncharacterized protein n=1 Tax=Virgisporangium aurantiacum TaxID=175570 RepID=A0A8J3Z2M1_9ACTN|nr:hypothetical protein [Virgisporangium aurantiacum]GIJ56129.1 hypothetical protein Vau01_036450 [Virgisporangium aurantiacum]
MSAREWPERHTYLAHALALSALHGPGPWPDGGAPLPDAKPPAEQPFLSEVVFEGIRTHHGAAGDDEADAILDLVARIEALTSGPPDAAALHDAAALEALHDAAAAVSPLSVADVLVRECTERDLDGGRFREVGRWLAENGGRRAAVAVGIVLLGVAGDTRDRSLLLLLGALEDLTLYATVALLRSQPDRDRAVFDLARRVDGWGRIHAVERLAGTGDPEIKGWLLREGYRNGIMNEYLAHLAATTGDLAGALAADPVSDDVIDGAGGILLALCNGGPARDMTDYEDGPVAVERYLVQVGRRPPVLRRMAIVGTLNRSLTDLPWDGAVRAALSARCTGLTDRADWRATLADAVGSDDLEVFRRAIWPATTVGVPIRDRLKHHLPAAPFDMDLWWPLVDDPGDFDEVVELATELLPLDDLATGPGLTLTFCAGPAGILDVVVSRLADHPGTGWPLIRAALSNETIRNRNMALQALAAWPTVPAEVAAAVREAARIEPDDRLRAAMAALLADRG